MRKPPKQVYLSVSRDGNVLGMNTNLAELKDDTSGAWAVIYRYRNPVVHDERPERLKEK